MLPAAFLAQVYNGTEEQSNNSSFGCVFDTKEEYLTHLLRTHELAKDSKKYQDGCLHFTGTLKIDQRVKKGLNWDDVVVTSAIVENGMISRYQYLPRTTKGVKTSLAIPSLELYMLHNNFDAICCNGTYTVDLLRISEQASHLDFSSVRTKLTLFYGQRIALSRLPKADNILGLNPSRLVVDCPDAYYVARDKGCCAEILKILKPHNPMTACLYRIIRHKK
jgi:hypothetical protein